MALRSRVRIGIAIFAIIVLGIFLPPFINLNRYRGKIASSIGHAMGRHVTVGSVSPRIFPQPGFDLGNLTVGEDSAFGSEPMLHADEVRAALRLSSLWRGRLEIAKLSLKYPSLNLVRAADGQWNIESLLRQASQIPTAPTSQTRPESRSRFPYIEADKGRINFKLGQEKKVYALADADFALWLASENELRTRLTARMVRTDSYLSDTGTVRFDGRFLRASDLRDTPLNATISLTRAQLGQLTKLVDGRDHGWRGAVDAELALGGTPGAMTFSAKASIDDFRRYDIGSVEKVRLEARCTGQFSSASHAISGIDCQMPAGDGVIRLNGELDGIGGTPSYDLSLAAQKLPARMLVSLARHAKKDIPDDLTASGNVEATLTFRKTAFDTSAVWSGSGNAVDLVLRSADLSPELAVKDIQFAVQPPNSEKLPKRRGTAPQLPVPSAEPRLTVVPFAIPLGGTEPAKVSAWFTASDYNVSLQGDTQLPRLLQVARIVGIRAPQMNADGSAVVNVALAGKWTGFEPPKPTGTAQLHAVKARMKGIASPLQIATATVEMTPDALNISTVSASFSDSHLNLTGALRMPRLCTAIENCPVQFELHADQISTEELNQLFNPRAAKRPWYAILDSRPEASILNKVQASGKITAARLTMSSMVANRVVAQAHLQAGQITLSDVRADIWGGKHSGQWIADFTGDIPRYSGNGILDAVAMGQVAMLMHDNWAAGAINMAYKISAAGLTSSQLIESAKGDINFDWRIGTLRHITLNGSNLPLSFRQFSGTVEFRDSRVNVPESRMTTANGIYQLSGTASLGRQVDLKLRNGSHAYTVTGTLEKPKVTPAPQTEAQVSLKP